MVYHLPIPLGFKGLNIVHLEMLNILVAIKLFCTHWKRMNILIYGGNFAVVTVLRSGRARDPYLAACACNIWLWAATHDINVTYTHVSGKNNRTAESQKQPKANGVMFRTFVSFCVYMSIAVENIDVNGLLAFLECHVG